jgi:hypothetical protein
MTRAPRIAIVALRDSHECTLDIGFRASVKDLCLLSDLVTGPATTGSLPTAKTIGIFAVAAFAASTGCN